MAPPSQWRRGRIATLRATLPLVLVALVLAPSATGSWSANGDFEPDTIEDVVGGRMFPDPDTSPSGMRVYFDAVVVDKAASANPNVGALRSRILTSGPLAMTAWLGVWKDCNADGYIGHLETAMLEYKPELLLDDGICPSGSMWNRNKWVSEFVHIGDERPQTSVAFPRVLTDDEADVWGDFGRPGVDVRYLCAASSTLPRGSIDSTGGILRHVDCATGYHVGPAVNEADATAGAGLAFDDPYHPEADCDHPLYVGLDLAGDDPCNADDPGLLEGDSAPPMFTIYDCSSSPSQLAPAPGDTDGSLVSGARTTCLRGSVGEADDPGWLARDWFFGGTQVYGSGDAGTDPTEGKRRPDFTFEFDVGYGTGGYQIPFSFDPGEPAMLGLAGRVGAPWRSVETYAPPANMGATFRGGTLEPASAQYLTFYAVLGGQTLSKGVLLPHQTDATYGAEACQGAEYGVLRGWDCDPAHWWNPAFGGLDEPDGARPGQRYHLRDTDCLDGQLADGTGVHAGLAWLSNDLPCPTMG